MIDPKRIAADAVQRLADSEPDEDAIAAMDHLAGTPQESMFCVSAPVLERVIEVAIADALFDASRVSLLERHRDGERLMEILADLGDFGWASDGTFTAPTPHAKELYERVAALSHATPPAASPEPGQAFCQLCGEPMPEGEEMFQYHGHSGPCPHPARSGG